MKEGRLLKAYGGYFFVYDFTTEEVYKAKIRGRLKQKEVEIIPGDEVEFSLLEDGSAVIEGRLERKNSLFRPSIANVEQIIITFAIDNPAVNLKLLDRLLVLGEVAVTEADLGLVICLNKIDLSDRAQARKVMTPYEEIGYQVIYTSAKKEEGISDLTEVLEDKISVFAGPSGVGKSSLLNTVQPGLELKTGRVSNKANQGRHTTRKVELLPLKIGGWVADTPGFSSLDLTFIASRELQYFFPEMVKYIGQCKFTSCWHDHEPECAVKRAVEEGKIANHRYQHYLEFLEEIKSDRKGEF